MRLSTKGRYGTRAILEIAKAYGKNPVKRREIVESQQVPDSYIENILVALKAAGLIGTIRGANGGYELSRAPEKITVLEVIEALEGTIAPVYCLEESSKECDRIDHCTTREIWDEMYQAMRNVLLSYTLADIIRKEEQNPLPDYSI